MYEIHADRVHVGQGAVIEAGVVIQGRSAKQAKSVHIGDNAFIGAGTKIVVDDFHIGDYSILHNHSLVAGDLPCTIGACCWIGEHTILNSAGGLTLGNGVGIGAYSQLWTHIKHGDVLQGCRWNATKPMTIGDDVWLVGHCIVSPIQAGPRSMAMVGSVITRDMDPDRTYAGVPAKDVTDKLGPQFSPLPNEEKLSRLQQLQREFFLAHPDWDSTMIHVALSNEGGSEQATIFDVTARTYRPRRTPEEFAFMRFLLSRTIKFFPSYA